MLPEQRNKHVFEELGARAVRFHERNPCQKIHFSIQIKNKGVKKFIFNSNFFKNNIKNAFSNPKP